MRRINSVTKQKEELSFLCLSRKSIKRAEQMQPVIQVEAGRIADIVFTQGVPLGDSAARNFLVKENDQQRLKNIQNVSSLDAWMPTKRGHE